MLDNDTVEIHQIKDIKDDLEYYIENCRDPDFMENDMLYEDIDGLEEMQLEEGNDNDFDYLFKIISFSMFKDKVAALRKKKEDKQEKLKIMEGKSPADIYNEDLDDFLAKLESEPSNTVPFYVHDDDSDDDDDSGSGSDSEGSDSEGSGSGFGSAPTNDDGAGPSNVARTQSKTRSNDPRPGTYFDCACSGSGSDDEEF